jgi:hypothetical protein
MSGDRALLALAWLHPFGTSRLYAAWRQIPAATIHRRLGRLAAAGLLGRVSPTTANGRPAARWHLTDAGLAALAADLGHPAGMVAAAGRAGGRHLARALRRPAATAARETIVLGLLARHGPGACPLDYQAPALVRPPAPAGGTPGRLALFARLRLRDAAGRERAFLLWRDRPLEPPARQWRRLRPLVQALAAPRGDDGVAPIGTGLLILVDRSRRRAAWQPLLDAAPRAAGGRAVVRLTTADGRPWRADGTAAPTDVVSPRTSVGPVDPRPGPDLRALVAARCAAAEGPGGRAAPGIDAALRAARSRPGAACPPAALALLVAIARGPARPVADLPVVLGLAPATIRERLAPLLADGLARILAADELAGLPPAGRGPLARRRLVAATGAGIAALAERAEATTARAVATCGYVGGDGPDDPGHGPYRALLRQAAHTVALHDLERETRLVALAWPRDPGTPAPRLRWALGHRLGHRSWRPDAGGIWSLHGRAFPFLVEYDAGTEGRRHHAAKLATYARFAADPVAAARFPRGRPPVLVVARDEASRDRFLAGVRAAPDAAAGWAWWFTTRAVLARTPGGLLGPAWIGEAGERHRRWYAPPPALASPPRPVAPGTSGNAGEDDLARSGDRALARYLGRHPDRPD